MSLFLKTVSVALDLTIRPRPSWACGLKLFSGGNGGFTSNVTPLVGVWIEMSTTEYDVENMSVTPLVGVWIEMHLLACMLRFSARHAPRGRVD